MSRSRPANRTPRVRIQSNQDVLYFVTVRTEVVTDLVERGETDPEEIRRAARVEMKPRRHVERHPRKVRPSTGLLCHCSRIKDRIRGATARAVQQIRERRRHSFRGRDANRRILEQVGVSGLRALPSLAESAASDVRR